MTPTEQDTVQRLTQQYAQEPGALLPLLHAIQDTLGYIPESAVAAIAKSANRSRAEVHGVITYYHHFRVQAPGRHVLQICRAEACKACGADSLLEQARHALGCVPGQTSASGAVTLESVFCLGLCAAAPALQIDDALHARVEATQLKQLLATLEQTQ